MKIMKEIMLYLSAKRKNITFIFFIFFIPFI